MSVGEVECVGVLGDVEELCSLPLSLVESLKKFVPCRRILDDVMVGSPPICSVLEKLAAEFFLCVHLLRYRHDISSGRAHSTRVTHCKTHSKT